MYNLFLVFSYCFSVVCMSSRFCYCTQNWVTQKKSRKKKTNVIRLKTNERYTLYLLITGCFVFSFVVFYLSFSYSFSFIGAVFFFSSTCMLVFFLHVQNLSQMLLFFFIFLLCFPLSLFFHFHWDSSVYLFHLILERKVVGLWKVLIKQ